MEKAFDGIIRRALEKGIATEKDIARQFGVSRVTIRRWRDGESAPSPAMCERVVGWIAERIGERAVRRPPRTPKEVAAKMAEIGPLPSTLAMPASANEKNCVTCVVLGGGVDAEVGYLAGLVCGLTIANKLEESVARAVVMAHLCEKHQVMLQAGETVAGELLLVKAKKKKGRPT